MFFFSSFSKTWSYSICSVVLVANNSNTICCNQIYKKTVHSYINTRWRYPIRYKVTYTQVLFSTNKHLIHTFFVFFSLNNFVNSYFITLNGENKLLFIINTGVFDSRPLLSLFKSHEYVLSLALHEVVFFFYIIIIHQVVFLTKISVPVRCTIIGSALHR